MRWIELWLFWTSWFVLTEFLDAFSLYDASLSVGGGKLDGGIDGSRYPKFRVGGRRRQEQEQQQPGDGGEVFLQIMPLIGGPTWLPIHVRVVVVEEKAQSLSSSSFGTNNHGNSGGSSSRSCCCWHTWDFVPLNATEQETLQRLVQLQETPGVLRYKNHTTTPTLTTMTAKQSSLQKPLSKSEEVGPSLVQCAQSFCETYPNRNLHLVTNNCWTFAIQLAWNLVVADK